jgi:outer membrane protein assembly factor BamB
MRNRLILSTLLMMLFSHALVQAQETLVVNYRGNAQRTGVYDAKTIDEVPAIAWHDSFASSDVDVFVVGNQIFVTATEQRNQSTLYALATSGERQWSVPLSGAIMGPMAYGSGLLLAGTSSGRLNAIDPSNGETRWTFLRSGRVWGAPLVVDDRVYISSANGWFALDAETGDELWHNNGCRESSSGVLSDTILFFPCRTSSSIEALDAETGRTLWSLELDAAPVYSLAVEGNMLVATGEQSIYAVDIDTQKVIWKDTPGLNWSAPIVTENRVFAGNMNGFFYAYDRASGELLWDFQVDDWATTDPALIGETLYFGFGNHFDPAVPHNFYALDADSSEILWQFEMDGMVINEALAGDDLLYVTTNNGTLYVLQEPDA